MLHLLLTAWAVPPLTAVQTTLPPTSGDHLEVITACPAGYVALSGGTTIYGQITGLTVLQDSPWDNQATPWGWFTAVWRDPAAVGTSWGVQGSVLCLDATLDASLVRVTASGTMGTASVGTWTAVCPAGMQVLSGGVELSGDFDDRGVAASYPFRATGWRASVVDLHPSTPERPSFTDVTVTAWCIDEVVRRQRVRVVSVQTQGTATPSSTAPCPRGWYAVGGGGQVSPAIGGAALTTSAPNAPGGPSDAWNVTAQELEPQAGPWGVVAYAICLSP
jgi:hypothetical protein